MNPISRSNKRQASWVLALLIHSSAGAVLVELSAAEQAKVRPILELSRVVDRMKSARQTQFRCGPQQTVSKTVGSDAQKRVHFVGYFYTVPEAQTQTVRFYYYDSRGKLKLMQYYSSGTYAWGQAHAEVWEMYFTAPQPLLKTTRSGKLWNTLKPLEVLEPDPRAAAERSPERDCRRLFK